ncbi:class I SAM-dependent methyltransferase [bacterium]|nr:class I SAM-dependent methyltransferase [bacterium]
MLARVLEPEVMDTPDDARDYDAMDHSAVNATFAADFLARWDSRGMVLDVGTGTAQIPIELCRRHDSIFVVAVDLAEEMLALARKNVEAAGFTGRIRLTRIDAKGLPYHPGAFGAVVSNSIIHHIPEPTSTFAGMHAVCADGGLIFVRDLFRPPDEDTLRRLVATYAAGCNAHQMQLFADSLRAALTVEEVRELVGRLGYAPETVQATSDRHWTFAAVRPAR